jgi:hypothetical protein
MKPHSHGATTPEDIQDGSAASEHRRFGGIKAGSAFLGWMTATGISVLLIALITAVTALTGAAVDVNPSNVLNQAAENVQAVNITAGIILAVVLFISYYCGGYVAARLARFDGAKQGVAVWLWALAATVIAAALAALAGTAFNDLLNATAFPGIRPNAEAMTAGGATFLIITALVTLSGAVLGGLMGTRTPHRVDRAAADRRFGWSKRSGHTPAT